jgi:LacI family transcriptional regulator
MVMKAKPATIRDVAEASGVSSATVSYVLNDGPRRVEPATRARVLAAMERLQYHPNTMARAMNRKRLDCLGVVFPQPNPTLVGDSYFGAVLDGIIHKATERRQNVTLYTGMEWHSRESLPAFRDRRVDGLLLIATLTDSDIVPQLTEAGIPFVLISNTVADPRVWSVDIDNEDAARQVVRHFVSLGHRRIALLGGQPNSPSTRPRRVGFERAMRELNLPIDPVLMLEGFYTREWGEEAMARLLRLPEPPTAVFAGGDGIAYGAYRACAAAGVSIPNQVSIIGFDDAPFAQTMTPPMTTMRHPLVEVGAAATALLLDQLDSEEAPETARKTVLHAELIVRGSTAAPRTQPILRL